MKCPVCGGNITAGISNLPVELETGLLYIKEIPAEICEQCGETFFSDDVSESLEKIVTEAKANRVEIEVVNYQSAA